MLAAGPLYESPEEPMPTTASRDLDQARRLERGLIRVRWFGVFLGVYLVSQTNTGFPPFASRVTLGFAYTLISLLALGNVVITMVLRRVTSLESLKRLGLAAFLFDAVI